MVGNILKGALCPITHISRPVSHFLCDVEWLEFTTSGTWEHMGKLTPKEIAQGPGKERSLYVSHSNVCVKKKKKCGSLQYIVNRNRNRYPHSFNPSLIFFSDLKTLAMQNPFLKGTSL